MTGIRPARHRDAGCRGPVPRDAFKVLEEITDPTKPGRCVRELGCHSFE